ncbi:hypothetical protein MKW98_008725 [Papaver atlanticum]|uniref:Uncharacterized protein n=1 Tax=Papaver atlanticum TaxID=357466 RepID=A0AAD4TEE4_9MAGN|nr:hypothetical protein MKW98_008725 [Papaver atlanticum]
MFRQTEEIEVIVGVSFVYRCSTTFVMISLQHSTTGKFAIWDNKNTKGATYYRGTAVAVVVSVITSPLQLGTLLEQDS